jgi:S1-C subfamily serine protease
MRKEIAALALPFVLIGLNLAEAQEFHRVPTTPPDKIEVEGRPLNDTQQRSVTAPTPDAFRQLRPDLPIAQLAKIAQRPISISGVITRNATDAQVYRIASPSVVEVLTQNGFGSGTLIGGGGEILTSYHVVKGYSDVAIVFKPATEGMAPTRDDMRLGHLVKYDELSDLALVRVSDVPVGRKPIRLGDESEIAVGIDVHAIGHPTGEAWTYTKGVVSQFRIGYEWTIDQVRHRANVIQTQTPINPGNSGGPLLTDAATQIGVNTFKGDGEGLTFAVSVGDVKRFISNEGSSPSVAEKAPCSWKESSRSRNSKNDASVIYYDSDCSGRVNAAYTIPDKTTEPITLAVDRNGDGRVDVVFFDFQRRGKWDLSFWDDSYSGRWTLVGYHLDGSLKPSKFESYDVFQRKLAQR